jgi:hypothetical protein
MLPASPLVLNVSDAEISGELSFVKCLLTPAGVLWRKCQKPREDFLAIAGKHGFGVKLHSVHGEFAMTERHDFSVVAFCGDFEAGR